MRQRIRLYELRIGMFVAELETEHDAPIGNFLITDVTQLQTIRDSKVISIVIDTAKSRCGRDFHAPHKPIYDHQRFMDELLGHHTKDEVARARRAINETLPNIKTMLAKARGEATLELEDAAAAVDLVMSLAHDDVAALIAVTRLKDKDEGTFLHSLAVSAIIVTFSRSLKLEDETISTFGIGGLLHDVGKQATPLEILTKPGKLTPLEFDIVKRHPEQGYHLLKKIAGTPKAVLEICRYHHEKYDGSGYPHGLAGKDIPFPARLAAICDVYDALTTIRPYKQACSQQEAINVMLHSAGHFDPALLQQFVSRMILSGVLH